MNEWTCAHCGLPSGQQGHFQREIPERGIRFCPRSRRYRLEGGVEVGFCCPEGHSCPQSIPQWAQDQWKRGGGTGA